MKKEIDELDIDFENAEVSDAEVLYDADAVQRVGLDLESNGKLLTVYHNLKPLSDARFFAREMAIANLQKQQSAVANAVIQTARKNNESDDEIKERLDRIEAEYLPKLHKITFDLWDDLAESREGYKNADRADWKEKTDAYHKLNAITALLFCLPLELDASESDDLFDEDALEEIKLKVVFSCEDLTVSHFFKPVSQKDRDSYNDILAGRTIASAAHISDAERIAKLYDRMIETQVGYNGRTPAAHKIFAVKTLFDRDAEKLGKFIKQSPQKSGNTSQPITD